MATTRNRYVTDGRGRRVAVLVPLEQYEELLEDLHDLAVVAERRTEPAVSHTAVKKRLRVGGVLPR